MSALSDRHEAVRRRDRGCVLKRLIPGHKCSGVLQDMHVPPKQAVTRFHGDIRIRVGRGEKLSEPLRRFYETGPELVNADPDLGFLGCETGHTDWDLNGKRCRRDRLPKRLEDKVALYGLEPLLDRLTWGDR